MAKHFSEIEKQLIKKRLLVEGKELFENYGIKKTSVDKIVDQVGIAKGSFYNFYASKESMVYDLIMDIEIKMHKDEMDNLHDFLKKYKFPEALKYTVWKSLRYMDEEPLLLIHNDPQLLYEIWSKSSKEEKERGACHDQNRVLDFVDAAKQMGYKLTVPDTVLNASLMSFFMIFVNQNMIGNSGQEALELIMQSTFDKLFIKG
jgi:AcrR family transcriptional regulator